jgi:hypothetical protein
MKLVSRMLLLNLIACGATLLWSSLIVTGQERREGPRPQTHSARPLPPAELSDPLKQNALSVIEREIERAEKYTQTSAKVMVWTPAADVLWDYDAAKARALLRNAYAQTERAQPAARQGESAVLRGVRAQTLQGRLRADILSVAQRHDPTLVTELVESVKEDKNDLVTLHREPLIFGSSSEQKRGLALLAAQLAPTEPERAVEYAVASLDYGVPQEFNDVFRVLLAVDPKYAHQLFAAATEKFSADPSPNIYDAMILAGYLRLLPQPESDGPLVRRFLGAAFERLKRAREQTMADGSAGDGPRSALFFAVNQLLIFYRIYWPEQVGEVWAFSRQLTPELKAEQLAAAELFPTEASRNDTTSILARAEAEKNEDNRDALYFQAALTCAKQGDYQRALEIAGRTRSGDKREAVCTYIHRAQAQQLVSAGELDDALKVSAQITAPEEKAEVTVLLVNAARKKGDNVLARMVLSETQKLLTNQPGSVSHARAYLWLASACSSVDRWTGFEMMTSAVKLANSATELDDFRTEPKLLSLGGASAQAIYVGDSKGDFRAGFRQLAKDDFVRTIAIAEGFNNELLRGVSIITAAASVLKERPEKLLSSK